MTTPRQFADALWRVVAAGLSLLGALLIGSAPSAAIGPEIPVDFNADYLSKGFVIMIVEPADVADLQLSRLLYQDGEVLQREALEWRAYDAGRYTAPITAPGDFRYRNPPRRAPDAPAARRVPAQPPLQVDRAARSALDALGKSATDAKRVRVGVKVPLQAAWMADLKDGVYAQKFVATAQLSGEDAHGKPLTVTRWAHFVVRDHRAQFISQAEYSRLVDPPTRGVDARGQKVEINAGRGVAAAVPLDKTELNHAVPLGRFGGAVAEQEAAPRPHDTKEAVDDGAERQER